MLGTKYPAKTFSGKEGGSGLRAPLIASQLQYSKELQLQTRISAALRIIKFGASKKFIIISGEQTYSTKQNTCQNQYVMKNVEIHPV